MQEKEDVDYTVGSYLAKRLKQADVSNAFTVPGDFSVSLLDELKRDGHIELITCCNELNAAYAADGYSRECKTIGVVVVTFMVGSLSILNAVAGAFAEDVPLLVVCGSPNTKELIEQNIIHHSLTDRDYNSSVRCYDALKVPTFAVRSTKMATAMIDDAIHRCIDSSKPVYLEIPCDIVKCVVAPPTSLETFRSTLMFESEELSLENATNAINEKINQSDNVVVVAGAKILKIFDGKNLFSTFAHALGGAVATMPDAKGVFSEEDEQFIGCYWGPVSWPAVEDAVKEADLAIFVGPIFSDFNTVAWNMRVDENKKIVIAADHVHIQGQRFPFVYMPDVLNRMVELTSKKPKSLERFVARVKSEGDKLKAPEYSLDQPLNGYTLQQIIQQNIQHYSSVVVDTGDAWFIGQKLVITEGTDFYVQLQYGSIGWSVGAVLGCGVGNKCAQSGRTLALIGDGAFQAAAQELSTWIKQGIDVTAIILNNGCYAIENQLHREQYNTLVSWKYSELANVFNDLKTKVFSTCVKTVDELNSAFDAVMEFQGVALIECQFDSSDCTNELKTWSRILTEYTRR